MIAVGTVMPKWWEDCMADLSHAMRWPPAVVDDMTFSEGLRHLEQARRINKERAK